MLDPAAGPRMWARIPGFLRFVLRRFREDRLPQTAASLAFTTLLSLVPLVTVSLAVLAAFPVFSDLMTQLKIFLLTHMVPEMAGKIITVYMVQFSEKAARLTLVGILFLLVTALLLIQTIDQAFNGIWRVRRQRPALQRLLLYWAVLTAGPILLGASLSITSYLTSLSLGYVKHVPVLGVHLLRPLPVILMSLGFALLYVLVPNRPVAFRHALIGGALAGVGFELMKKVFAWYITSFPTYRLVYGAFAALPIFLLWIYLSWLMVLVGALFTAALEHWRDDAWRERKYPGWRFVAALQVLGALVAAQRHGKTVGLDALGRQLAVGVEDIEALLEAMHRAGLVAHAEDGGWLLARASHETGVEEIHRLFLWEAEASLAGVTDPTLRAYLETLKRVQKPVLDHKLSDVFAAA